MQNTVRAFKHLHFSEIIKACLCPSRFNSTNWAWTGFFTS